MTKELRELESSRWSLLLCMAELMVHEPPMALERDPYQELQYREIQASDLMKEGWAVLAMLNHRIEEEKRRPLQEAVAALRKDPN